MPKLPDYTALGGTIQPRPSGTVPHYSAAGFNYLGPRGGQYLGQALQKIGGELESFGAREKNKADALQNAEATADFSINLDRSFAEKSRQPDYEAAPEEFRAAGRAALEQSGAQIQDPYQKQMFAARHSATIESHALQLEGHALGRRKQEILSGHDEQAKELGRQAAANPDPEYRAQKLREIHDLIASELPAGYSTAAQVRTRTQAFVSQFAKGFRDDWAERDPEGYLKATEGVLPSEGIRTPGHSGLSPEQQGAALRTVNAARPDANWGDPRAAGFQGDHLTTIKTQDGTKVTVNKFAAPAFQGFLNDLEARGYKIDDIGGYNFRNKRGSNELSQHAFGNALDINPDKNPHQREFKTDLPPDVGEMAAKWGLSWGGNWSGKKDTMHFEYTGIGAGVMQAARPSQPQQSAQPAPRDYGDTKFPIQVPGLAVGSALEQAKSSGVWDQLPPALRKKFESAGIMSGLTIDKGDLDSVPDAAWGKIATKFGLPAPAQKTAGKTSDAPANDSGGTEGSGSAGGGDQTTQVAQAGGKLTLPGKPALTGTPLDFLTPEEKFQGRERAERNIRARQIDQERGQRQVEHQQKQKSDAAEADIVRQSIENPGSVSAKDVVRNPNLGRDAMERMVRFTERENRPDPLARVSQQTSMDLLDRMRLPEGDPRRLPDQSAIYDAYIGGKLNRADFQFLQKQFADGASPEGGSLQKSRKGFLDGAKESLQLANQASTMTGGGGTFARYEFERAIDSKIDAYRKAGNDPLNLFDPTHKDYLGKLDQTGRPAILKPFLRDMQQQMREQAQTPTPAAPTAPPRPPIEEERRRLDEWLRGRGGPGLPVAPQPSIPPPDLSSVRP